MQSAMAVDDGLAPYGRAQSGRTGRPSSLPPSLITPTQTATSIGSEAQTERYLEDAAARVERAELRAFAFRDELRIATDTARARYAGEQAELSANYDSLKTRSQQEHNMLQQEYEALQRRHAHEQQEVLNASQMLRDAHQQEQQTLHDEYTSMNSQFQNAENLLQQRVSANSMTSQYSELRLQALSAQLASVSSAATQEAAVCRQNADTIATLQVKLQSGEDSESFLYS